MDELGDKRNQKKTIEGAKEMFEGLLGQGSIQEFSNWCLENMPNEHLGCHANTMVGTVLGCLIGTWYDAGADLQTTQEYLSRFAAMVHSLNNQARAAEGLPLVPVKPEPT